MRARAFCPFRLNPMSHIVSSMCLDQLSPITSCNRFCESRFAGITSQDFNNIISLCSNGSGGEKMYVLVTGH